MAQLRSPPLWVLINRMMGAWWLASGSVVVAAVTLAAQREGADPFAFFAPSVVVSAADRARLDRGQVLARTVPGRDGQLAVFVASRLNAQPETLVEWTREIAVFKRSQYVQAIGRFSEQPSVADVSALALDGRELEAIRRCRPGDCGLKLGAAEIQSLHGVIASAGAAWHDAVQREFRRLLVERVRQYRAGGLAALAAPADDRDAVPPSGSFAAILDQSPYLTHIPAAAAWLREYPRSSAEVESFFYWSREHFGDGKPVIAVTHVGSMRPGGGAGLPVVLVTGKQIFATHYVEGSLGVTAVLKDPATGATYLAYLNRSRLDLLKGLFGGLVRRIAERRVQRHAPQVIGALRSRLESGPPPRR